MNRARHLKFDDFVWNQVVFVTLYLYNSRMRPSSLMDRMLDSDSDDGGSIPSWGIIVCTIYI